MVTSARRRVRRPERAQLSRPFFRLDYHLESTLRVCQHRYRALRQDTAEPNNAVLQRGQERKRKAGSLRALSLSKKAPCKHEAAQRLHFYAELSAAVDVALQQSRWFSAEQAMAHMEDALFITMGLSQSYAHQPELKFLCEGVIIQIAEKLKTFAQLYLGHEWTPPAARTTTSSVCSDYCPTFGGPANARQGLPNNMKRSTSILDDHTSPRSVFSFCSPEPSLGQQAFPFQSSDPQQSNSFSKNDPPDVPPLSKERIGCAATDGGSAEDSSFLHFPMADILYRHRTTSDNAQLTPSDEASQDLFMDLAESDSAVNEEVQREMNVSESTIIGGTHTAQRSEKKPLYQRSSSSISTHCPHSPPSCASPSQPTNTTSLDRGCIDRTPLLNPKTFLLRKDVARYAEQRQNQREYPLNLSQAAGEPLGSISNTTRRQQQQQLHDSQEEEPSKGDFLKWETETATMTKKLLTAVDGKKSEEPVSLYKRINSPASCDSNLNYVPRPLSKNPLRPFLPIRTLYPAASLPTNDIEIHGRAGEPSKPLPPPKSLFGDRQPQTLSIESLQKIMEKRREQYEQYALVTFGSRDPRCQQQNNKCGTPRVETLTQLELQ